MDWSAHVSWILLVAFGIGALHALEPGHARPRCRDVLPRAAGASRELALHVPRVSAILVTVLGAALLVRSLFGHHHIAP